MEPTREILEGGKMQIIQGLEHDLAAARQQTENVLRLVGSEMLCPQCKGRVFLLRYAEARSISLHPPIEMHNVDGTAHRDTCPRKFAKEATDAKGR